MCPTGLCKPSGIQALPLPGTVIIIKMNDTMHSGLGMVLYVRDYNIECDQQLVTMIKTCDAEKHDHTSFCVNTY